MVSILRRARVRTIPTGLQHGTVTVLINGQTYEMTALRVDVATDGRHAVVRYTDDWRADAARRDLTINAMSLSLDGHLYDYFGGLADLERRHVAFVGDPEARIHEDYLRILRYFRFHTRINGTASHDSHTLRVIEACAAGLDGISGERIASEMHRILALPASPVTLRTVYAVGLAPHLGLPGAEQPSALAGLERYTAVCATASDPWTRLAALLPDAASLERLQRRWKPSNQQKARLAFILQHRERPVSLVYAQDLLVDACDRDNVLELLRYAGLPEAANALRDWAVPRFPISGQALVDLGIPWGPRIGEILRELKEQWKTSRYCLTEPQLMAAASELAAGHRERHAQTDR